MKTIVNTNMELVFLLKDLQFIKPESCVYFKVHDDLDERTMLDDQMVPIIFTDRESVLFFIMCFHTELSHCDEQGYQYWKLNLAALNDTSKVEIGLWSLEIFKHMVVPTPKKTSRKSKAA